MAGRQGDLLTEPDDFPRCVSCNRHLYHSYGFGINGFGYTNSQCIQCRNKDNEDMKLVEQIIRQPEIQYSPGELKRAVKYLWNVLNPAL